MKKLRKSFFTGFQAGIEAIDVNVAVIDRNWDIVLTNAGWREFGEQNSYNPGQTNGTPGGGCDYLENSVDVKKLGATLIELLCAQLQSELELQVNGGTQVSLRFEKEHMELQAV